MTNEFKPRKGLLLEDNVKALFGDAGAEGEIYSDGTILHIADPATSTSVRVGTNVLIQPAGVNSFTFNATQMETFDKNVAIYREDASDPKLTFEDGDNGGAAAMGIDWTDSSFQIAYGTGNLGSGHFVIRSDGDIELRVGANQVANLTDDTNLVMGVGANYAGISAGVTVFGQDSGVALAAGGNYNTIFGSAAGASLTTGDNCTFLGYGAGAAVTGGNNLAIGYNAMAAANAGTDLIAIGREAGASATGMSFSVFVGSYAGNEAGTANASIFMGYEAGRYCSGASNVLVGHRAGVGVTAVTNGVNNVFVGHSAGAGLRTGANNVGIGHLAAEGITNGTYNVCVGDAAGQNITTGGNNILLGYHAGDSVTGSTGQIAIGYNALSSSNSASSIAIGSEAGADVTSALNVMIGGTVAQNATTMLQSVIIGYNACNTGICTGDQHVIIGESAAQDVTTAANLVIVGRGAGANLTNTTTSDNVFIGHSCANTLIDYGLGNTCVGFESFYTAEGGFGTECDYNSALGYETLRSLTTGDRNVAVGYQAGYGITTSAGNVCIGTQTGKTITTGSSNIAIGPASMSTGAAKTGSANIALGVSTLTIATTAAGNIAFGYQTMIGATTAFNNVAIGYQAIGLDIMTGSYNNAIGHTALANITSGFANNMMGHAAGFSLGNNTCFYNVGIGDYSCGGNATAGAINTRYNVAIGHQALRALKGTAVATDGNVFIGYRSGYQVSAGANYNVGVGHFAGNAVTTGDYNVSIGYNSDCAPTGSYGLALGTNAVCIATNEIRLGSANNTRLYSQAALTNWGAGTALVITATGLINAFVSSEKFKNTIEDIGSDESDKIMSLRPVTYRFDAQEDDRPERTRMGFIAEEVNEVYPDSVEYNEDGEPWSVNYIDLIAPMLAEIKKLRAEVDALKEGN